MKNLIEPKIIAKFKQTPIPFEEISNFLDEHKDVSTSYLCNFLDVKPRQIYDWKHKNKTSKPKDCSSSLNIKKYGKYTAKEKLLFVMEYLKSNEKNKGKLLREYGLYRSDIDRWNNTIETASLEALGKRKKRNDAKTEEQKKIEQLEKELRNQEKTTAKLSHLLVLQKKTFEILERIE